MRGTTHSAGGLLFAVALLYAMGVKEVAHEEEVLLAASAFGALIPDIDHQGSKISKMNHASKIVSVVVSSLSRHRGITHTVPFCVAAAAPVFLLWKAGIHLMFPLGVGLFLGMVSHLVLDSFNPTGIMWMYPAKKKHYHIMRIRTGSVGETVFMIAVVALIAYLASGMTLKLF